MARKCIIGVIGGNICTSEASASALAVGADIAKAGVCLLTGGGPDRLLWESANPACGEPIKDAAMRGAADWEFKHNGQGRLIGVLPSTDLRQFRETRKQLLIR